MSSHEWHRFLAFMFAAGFVTGALFAVNVMAWVS